MFDATLLSKATDVLTTYYERTGTKPPFLIDELEKQLVNLGALDNADLQRLKWENLQALGLPLLVAQDVAAVFRRGATESTAQTVMIVRNESDQAAYMSPLELVQTFAANPAQLHTPVAEQIRARTGDKACIALTDDGKIDIAASAKAIEGIVLGDSYKDVIRIGDKLYDLYRINEATNSIRDEHPVFAGKPLNSDGTDHHGVFWGDVLRECRQLIRLARETGELKVTERTELVDLHERALRGFNHLAELYPKAFRLFRDKKGLDELPRLKTRLGKAA